jgi:hypothetical protein
MFQIIVVHEMVTLWEYLFDQEYIKRERESVEPRIYCV